MISSTARGLTFLAFLALAFVERNDAFVPNTLAFSRTATENAQNSNLAPRSSACQTTSSLSMGVMEEFITDRDEKTRKAGNDKYLAELQKRVDRINELEPSIEDLGDDELQAKTEEFKSRLQKGEDINGPILEEMFAVVREAAWYVVSILS